MGILSVHDNNKNVHGLSIENYGVYLFNTQYLSILSTLSILNMCFIIKNKQPPIIFVMHFIWKQNHYGQGGHHGQNLNSMFYNNIHYGQSLWTKGFIYGQR